MKEVRDALQIHIETEEEIQQACELLKDKLKADKILITLSEKGAILFSDQFYRVAAVPRNIVDVSGAGDTVIAVASICLANQWSDKKLVEYSNLAGGLVCEKAGVVYLTKETLFKEI